MTKVENVEDIDHRNLDTQSQSQTRNVNSNPRGDINKLSHCKCFCFDVGGEPVNQMQGHEKEEIRGVKKMKPTLKPEELKIPEFKRRSVFSYVYSELTRGYLLENDEAKYSEKRQRVYTFMKIPRELEKFMLYGFFQCLDAFLYVFTFLPLRFTVGLLKLLVKLILSVCVSSQRRLLEPAQICDLLKGVILLTCCFLMQHVDISMMYHIIRGQAIIKLYLFFNMLEVADRLFASFGQDILDALFWTATEPRDRKREHFGVIPHFALAVFYVFGHGVLILFQATTLNVAFNSHNKALLTIMMSNNFVELKGSVFKKFEKNNLFQMSCSDVRERFHFVILLSIVCMRNLTEFSWSLSHMLVLFPDVLMVLCSEFLVDWVKHAFITKFNEIPDDIYKEYTKSIAYDMMQVRMKKSHSDQLDLLSRRMGFTPLPLAVILVRVVAMSINIDTYKTLGIALLVYICLVSFKVLNSIILLGKACSYVNPETPPAQPTQQSPLLSPDLQKRRCSDPILDRKSAEAAEVLKPSCLKRSTSVSGKMNVTFSDHEDSLLLGATTSTPVIIENSLQHDVLSPKILFSNSTVSLQSMGLNEELIQEEAERTVGNVVSMVSSSPEKSEVKQRKPQKDLGEIDRYTMCSNRIII